MTLLCKRLLIKNWVLGGFLLLVTREECVNFFEYIVFRLQTRKEGNRRNPFSLSTYLDSSTNVNTMKFNGLESETVK